MAGMKFEFKIGEQVIYIPDCAKVSIRARMIESIGKTYLIKYKSGRLGGYVHEENLRAIEDSD